MGIPISLILIAAGAILTWGVTDEPSGLNLDAIGVILMVIGVVALVLTLLLWQSWWGPGYWRSATYVDDAPGGRAVTGGGGAQQDDVRRGRGSSASGRTRTASSVALRKAQSRDAAVSPRRPRVLGTSTPAAATPDLGPVPRATRYEGLSLVRMLRGLALVTNVSR